MVTPCEICERKLRDGMHEGNMHACIRDIGRLAGGYFAAGELVLSELGQLEALAISLAVNDKEAHRKWADATQYGQQEPVRRDNTFVPVRAAEALAWDATIGPREVEAPQIVRQEWMQIEALPPAPDDTWNGIQDFATYLQALFNANELVGYVTDSWETDPDKEGDIKHLPKRGVWDRTAGELLETLACADELGEVLGDWAPSAGAWIRFNPLDGDGCTDRNVTAYRYALVESDTISIEQQYTIYRELELPIAAMVHSGGKSLHAIVRIDASDLKEYRKRVDFLYDVCKKNGLHIDGQNRNPSRLSRLPGATRNGEKQWLVATRIGKDTWAEWEDWIAAQNDDLPDVETLSNVLDNLPPLAPELIAGLLRRRHKMLLAGPSKAGKSFLLLELAIAIAEGRDWLGWQCKRGRVLYVNLELDRASALHRTANVYKTLDILPKHADDIDFWHLRGKAVPMTELAPRLIRRALKRNYAAVIIDPIYKVITGDENAAHEMAKFCNQFDRVCAELGAATIYCHHHSKGEQGQKQAHDRASGSGVFARDPDTLIDLIELDIDDYRRKQIINQWEADALAEIYDMLDPEWREWCPQDTAVVGKKLAEWGIANGHEETVRTVRPQARIAAEHATGWRIEGILREFPTFPARRVWFRYPVHIADEWELLEDALALGEIPKKKTRAEANTNRQTTQTADAWKAFADVQLAGIVPVTVKEMAAFMHDSKTGGTGIQPRSARPRIIEAGYLVSHGIVTEKEGTKTQ